MINTTRLLLRDYRENDFADVYEIDASDIVQKMRGPNSSTSKAQSRERFDLALNAVAQSPRLIWHLVAVIQDDDRCIGACKLTIHPQQMHEGEIGYYLKQSAWGRGYATEIAHGLLDFGFGQLKLHRIVAGCWAQNPASVRVLEKAGMRREAHFREHLWFNNAWQDSFDYAILRREWDDE